MFGKNKMLSQDKNNTNNVEPQVTVTTASTDSQFIAVHNPNAGQLHDSVSKSWHSPSPVMEKPTCESVGKNVCVLHLGTGRWIIVWKTDSS